MTYRRLKLLMKKLKWLIDLSNTNNPHVAILLPKPCELQVLYDELGSMIQSLRGNSLEQVRNLKTRFEDVAEEVHDMFDLYVPETSFNSRYQIYLALHCILDSRMKLIEDVMRSIMSIKEDYMDMESSPTPKTTDGLKPQAAAASGVTSSRHSQVWDEIIVGLDRDLDLIRGKLAEDTRKLEIVSIVGMGGSGKTTLVTKVFNDSFVGYHFNIRGWVTVSQTYEKTDLVNQILASIGVEVDLDKRDDFSHLREKLHKRLMGQRYLVVVDDIWNAEAWEDLKVVFPDHNNGSRLLLTSRHKNVALHAKPHGFVHQLRCLTDEESWELLHKKVFHGHDFPDWVIGPGMQIARNCRGLPLAVVVIAGVLAKEPVTKDSWERISQSGSSSIMVNGHMETLALSLDHLPSHLRNCFLYLGGFPEDYKFQVTRLIWIWIAEGFIEESKNQSLEETAKDYLLELVDRNLVVVQGRKFDGDIKIFSVHDVLRELSSEIASKERYSMKVLGWGNCVIAPYKTSRLLIRFLSHYPVWTFHLYIKLKCSRSWRLLTVLDLKQCCLEYFPEKISLLVKLRYLAFRIDSRDFQSPICHLRSLQTLIIEAFNTSSDYYLVLPDTISNLVNLRHLQCRRAIIFPPLETPFMNLQTISNVDMGHEPTSWVNYFPGVKKLSCSLHGDRKYDLQSLTFLEILKIGCAKSKSIPRFKKKNMIRFPTSLKKLTVKGCRLPWSSMSNIQSLPNLEVLKLLEDAFVGPQWDAGEEPFQQLKFLKLEGLDINQWEASAINFPCIKQLVLHSCYSLKRIPPDMGYIPTLECIQIEDDNYSIIQSAYEIQEEQHADGNCDLKIRVENVSSTTWMHYRRRLDLIHKQKLNNIFNNMGESDTKVRTGISINLLTPHELETLGLPINESPAHHHTRRNRIWNDGRSKNHPTKPKMLKRWKNQVVPIVTVDMCFDIHIFIYNVTYNFCNFTNYKPYDC